MLQVTPTGPWGKDVHPNMPVALDELLADLRECFQAGATGVHLHVRDKFGAETLDSAVVDETCRRVREVAAEVGVAAEIGLTTGAWIVPDLAGRIAMIREWEGVDCATVNLSERGFERVMQVMLDVGIGIDVGLWAPVEMDACSAPVSCRTFNGSASSWTQASRTTSLVSRPRSRSRSTTRLMQRDPAARG
jgi:uncharacterized protein (DUF849 family)